MPLRPQSISWLTTLSLDAPLVAIAWQELLAEPGQIGWTQRALLFAAVWLGYTADRWLDGFRLQRRLSQRHSFHYTHRRSVFICWCAILLASVTLAFVRLPPIELYSGLALAFLAAALTLILQLDATRRWRLWLKPASTSALVSASCLLFVAPSSVLSPAWLLAIYLQLFFLFFVNCSLIHYWDARLDARQEGAIVVSRRPFLLGLALALLTQAALLVTPSAMASQPRQPVLSLAILLATASLTALHWKRRRIPLEARRTLADLFLAAAPLLLLMLTQA